MEPALVYLAITLITPLLVLCFNTFKKNSDGEIDCHPELLFLTILTGPFGPLVVGWFLCSGYTKNRDIKILNRYLKVLDLKPLNPIHSPKENEENFIYAVYQSTKKDISKREIKELLPKILNKSYSLLEFEHKFKVQPKKVKMKTFSDDFINKYGE